MLPLTRASLPQIPRRVNLLLAATVAAAIALPTVYLTRIPQALADATGPETPVAAAPAETTPVEAPAIVGSATPAAAPTLVAPTARAEQPAPTVAITFDSPAAPLTVAPVAAAAGPATTPTTTNAVAETKQRRPQPPAVEYLPSPSLAEVKIAAALANETDLEFTDTPLAEAMEFISDKHDIQIMIDNKGLQEAAVDENVPITKSVHGISLRSALRLILEQLDLTFLPHDEVLLITSSERAANQIVTRTYPVGDLAAADPGAPVAARSGGGLATAGKYDAAYQSLLEAITGAVEPGTWEESGGMGTVAVVVGSKSLVVSQTYDVQEKVLRLLRTLREARRSETSNTQAVNGAAAPSITVSLAGPQEIKVGETGEFTIEVRNTGQFAAHDVRLVASGDPALVAIMATEGLNIAGDDLIWFIDALPPGRAVHYRVRSRASNVAEQATNRVTVTSSDGAYAKAEAPVRVVPVKKTVTTEAPAALNPR